MIFAKRTKFYNKIVSNFEAGEVQQPLGGHLAEYVDCPNSHLQATFQHPDVQARGCTHVFLHRQIYKGRARIQKLEEEMEEQRLLEEMQEKEEEEPEEEKDIEEEEELEEEKEVPEENAEEEEMPEEENTEENKALSLGALFTGGVLGALVLDIFRHGQDMQRKAQKKYFYIDSDGVRRETTKRDLEKIILDFLLQANEGMYRGLETYKEHRGS